MNHLSNHITISKHFINVNIVKGSYYNILGKRPDVLYLDLEPYNRSLTLGYTDKLIDLIIKHKKTILNHFGKKYIVIDDIMTLTES